jgi:hypothetical protein
METAALAAASFWQVPGPDRHVTLLCGIGELPDDKERKHSRCTTSGSESITTEAIARCWGRHIAAQAQVPIVISADCAEGAWSRGEKPKACRTGHGAAWRWGAGDFADVLRLTVNKWLEDQALPKLHVIVSHGAYIQLLVAPGLAAHPENTASYLVRYTPGVAGVPQSQLLGIIHPKSTDLSAKDQELAATMDSWALQCDPAAVPVCRSEATANSEALDG